MRLRWRLTTGLALIGLLTSGEGAGAPPAEATERPGELVFVRLSAPAQVGPGQRFDLAVVFDIQPGWHIYWKNPGAGALAPRIIVTGPAGFEIGPVLWPRPEAVETDLGPEYFYARQTVLFVPVTAPPRLEEGRAAFEAAVTWAVCSNVCRLGKAARSIEIETAPQAVPSESPEPLVSAWRKRVPQPLGDAPDASVTFEGSVLAISGSADGREAAAFFPDGSPGVSFGTPRVAIQDDRFLVQVDVTLEPGNALGQPMTIGGLVALGEGLDDPAYDVHLPAPAR